MAMATNSISRVQCFGSANIVSARYSLIYAKLELKLIDLLRSKLI